VKWCRAEVERVFLPASPGTIKTYAENRPLGSSTEATAESRHGQTRSGKAAKYVSVEACGDRVLSSEQGKDSASYMLLPSPGWLSSASVCPERHLMEWRSRLVRTRFEWSFATQFIALPLLDLREPHRTAWDVEKVMSDEMETETS
jgi:hypothetical protein